MSEDSLSFDDPPNYSGLSQEDIEHIWKEKKINRISSREDILYKYKSLTEAVMRDTIVELEIKNSVLSKKCSVLHSSLKKAKDLISMMIKRIKELELQNLHTTQDNGDEQQRKNSQTSTEVPKLQLTDEPFSRLSTGNESASGDPSPRPSPTKSKKKRKSTSSSRISGESLSDISIPHSSGIISRWGPKLKHTQSMRHATTTTPNVQIVSVAQRGFSPASSPTPEQAKTRKSTKIKKRKLTKVLTASLLQEQPPTPHPTHNAGNGNTINRSPKFPSLTLRENEIFSEDGTLVFHSRFIADSRGLQKNTSTTIRAGRLSSLLTRLTFEQSPDPDFVNAFILSYNHFITSEELLESVTSRWNDNSPNITVLRLRVVNVLKTWIQKNGTAFTDTENLGTLLTNFVENAMKADKGQAPKVLIQALGRLQEEKDEISKIWNVPKSLAKDKKFLHFSAKVMAEQITLFQFWVLKTTNIENEICKVKHRAKILKFGRKLKIWVQHEILKSSQNNQKRQKASYIRFLKIALLCFNLHNFDSCISILQGLQKTLENVTFTEMYLMSIGDGLEDEDDLVGEAGLKQLEDICEVTKDFPKYKQLEQSFAPPLMPWMSDFKKKIKSLDILPNMFEGEFINMEKWGLLAVLIGEIKEIQQSPFKGVTLDEVSQSFLHKKIRLT